MIDNFLKKPGLIGGETLFTPPPKNEVHSEKNEVHLWFALFYDYLSKIFKNDLLSKMIKFRNDFNIIFRFCMPHFIPLFQW